MQVLKHIIALPVYFHNLTALQISMSVMKGLTAVEIMLIVSILKVTTFVPVHLDSLEMDRCAMVCIII